MCFDKVQHGGGVWGALHQVSTTMNSTFIIPILTMEFYMVKGFQSERTVDRAFTCAARKKG